MICKFTLRYVYFCVGDHMWSFEIEINDVEIFVCARDLLLLNLTQSQDQVQRGFLLDIVVGQRSAVFQLFSGKDQSLLVGRDAFFVLDFGFDVLNGVGRFNVQSDGLAGQCFDEDLHTTAQAQDQV